MASILVVSNCATDAYRSAFSLLLPKVDVVSLHLRYIKNAEKSVSNIWKKQRKQNQFNAILEKVESFDAIIGNPRAIEKFPAERLTNVKIIELPNFSFSGYHPDLCQIETDSQSGPQTQFGSLHSIIALAAFRAGLSEQETIKMYCSLTYQNIGYFEEWNASKQSLIKRFRDSSLSIEKLFNKWSHGGCFMYSAIHPNIKCLADIAKLICKEHFPDYLETEYLCPDYLANGAIFPCYSEIAEQVGSPGSYLFKISNEDKIINLEEFVQMCFSFYNEHVDCGLRIRKPFERKLARVEAYLQNTGVQANVESL